MRITAKSWKKRFCDTLVAVYKIETHRGEERLIAVHPFEHVWSLVGGHKYLILSRYSEYYYENGEIKVKFISNEKEQYN